MDENREIGGYPTKEQNAVLHINYGLKENGKPPADLSVSDDIFLCYAISLLAFAIANANIYLEKALEMFKNRQASDEELLEQLKNAKRAIYDAVENQGHIITLRNDDVE